MHFPRVLHISSAKLKVSDAYWDKMRNMMIQQKLVRPFKITMKFNLAEMLLSLLTKLEKKYQLCFLSGFEIKFEQTLKFCLKNNQV